MNNQIRRVTGMAAVIALLATVFALIPAPVALAAGTPDIALTKDMPARSLAGDPAIPVTLTATNPDTVVGYNLSFKDVLAPGVSYTGGAPAPTRVLSNAPSAGFTTLLWENVSDLPPNSTFTINYTFTHDTGYDVGDSITNDAAAYVNSDPRFIPKFDATGAPSAFTGNDADSKTTLLVPFLLFKEEPNAEAELLRGLHDHQTPYTLIIRNNFLDDTTTFEIRDWIPAGMEFLACGGVDNSATEEYPGSGPINPGNAPPLANPCLQPSTVDTVAVDPDGPGQAASQVYTEVVWSAADLGLTLTPGQEWKIDYVAAIPAYANELFVAPPAPASLLQAANVDNNTGASTQETASEQAMLNFAEATGVYAGDGATYSDDAYELVSSEDVSIHKGVDNGTIAQGGVDQWTLVIESSEYVGSASGIVVTDSTPDGLCPLGPGTAEGTAECDFGGEPSPSHPYTSAVENADGTWTLVWDFDSTPGLGAMARSESRTITFNTKVREFYQENGANAAPVVAEDSWTNVVDLTADVDGRSVFDESSAGQSAPSLSILKEVADDPASQPVPFACGDGSSLTWDPVLGSDYAPGDRACWRLTVFFPGNLDTAQAKITDFIPVGHAWTIDDTWTLGPATTPGVIVTPDLSAAAQGVLVWHVGDLGGFTDVGQVIEIVFSTTILSPADGFPGDLKQNLMKFTHENSAGAVFPLRDLADALWAEPVVDLDKQVVQVMRGGSPVPGATGDGVTVIEADVVTYRLRLTNTGTRVANDVEVIDTLPASFTCSEVVAPSITAPGACSADQIEWLGATGITVPAGGTVDLFYDVVVPLGVSPGQTFVNTAGVRTYQSPTNQGADFLYVPANNIDPAAPAANTERADDTSSIVTTGITFTKTRVTQLDEPGNSGLDQATIGEEITYTITAVIPEGHTVYGPAVVSDSLGPEMELVSAQITTWTGEAAAEPALSVDTGTDTITATFADPHSNPVGGPAPGDDTLEIEVVARVADVAGNTSGSTVDNSGRIDFETRPPLSTPQFETASVATTVVEPDISVTKDEDDPDDIVQPNDTLSYTITASNAAGQSVAHNVVITDVVPEGLTPATINDGGVFAPDGTPGNGIAGTITWTIASIAPGAASPVTYSVTVDDPAVFSTLLTNVATATATSMPGAVGGERTAASPNAGTPPSRYEESATDTVFAPSMSIAKSVAGSPATIGDDLQYTLDITIPAGSVGYDTTVLDTVPSGIVFLGTAAVSCTPSAGASCTPNITPVQIGSEPAWYLGDLVPSSSVARVVTIVYDAYVADTVGDGDTETNSAAVYANTIDRITVEPPATAPDPSGFDVSAGPATADVAVIEPTLTIDKDVVGQNADADYRRALPNETLTYQLTIENTGTAPAYDIVVADLVDARVVAGSIADGSDAGVSWTVTDADPSDGSLAWFVAGPVPVGTAFTINYDIDVWNATSADEAAAGPEFSNVADITSFWGVPAAERVVNGYSYREYTNVASDQVDIELDLASIGDRVWFDRNGDGVQDADEPGFENVGVTVTYYGLDDAPGGGDDEVFTTMTGPDGSWLVTDLPGGEYQVDVSAGDLPAGMSPTWDLDDLLVGPDGRWIGTLDEDADKRDVDFGYNGGGLIGDEIWFDRNGDGVFDADEFGIEGVVVTITWDGPDGPVSFVTTTNAAGGYEVDGLPPGDYTITVDPGTLPAGVSPTFDADGVATPNTAAVTLGDGVEYRDGDFGYNGDSSIGDNVWLDINGSGAPDIGEPGIPDVVVQLTWPGEDGVLGGGDDEVFIATTDADGDYLFAGLPPGDYQVDVLGGLPAFVTNTYDEDLDGDSSVVVTLAAADDHLTADFGYQGNTSVGDLVYFDVDNDGNYDAGEPGIPGVEVTLTYAGPDGTIGTSDDIQLDMTTDSDGAYLFTGLPEGDYEVAVTGGVPAGMVNSADEDGDLDGNSGEFNVPNMTMHLTADFGYTGTGSIGDTIWFDRNGDGVFDAGEPGFENVTVEITWGGADGTLGTADDVVLSTTTDANGGYSFPNLPPGDYEVAVDATSLPAGMDPITDPDGTLDNVHALTLADGETADTIDFGYRGAGSIGDTVYLDLDGDGAQGAGEPGIPEVTVQLTWPGEDGILGNADDETFTTVTGPDGMYLFDGLPEGDYEVTVAAGLPAGISNTADEDGDLDSTVTVVLGAADDHLTADFGYQGTTAVGDFVYFDTDGSGTEDPGEPGIPGVELTLTYAGPDNTVGTDDDIVLSTTTGADGSYDFTGLPAGEFVVAVTDGVPPGMSNTADPDGDLDGNSGQFGVPADTTNDTTDFGYTGSGSLGDFVWLDRNGDGAQDGDEPGLPNVVVNVTWAGADGVLGTADDVTLPATTDIDGAWTVANLPPGDYEVTVDPASLPPTLAPTFDRDASADGTTQLTLGDGENLDDVDFGYNGGASIGDMVWFDRNGNGVLDADEYGLEGVTVDLTWAGPDGFFGTADDETFATATGPDGSYIFDNLPEGEYQVTVDAGTLPPGMSQTYDEDLTLDNTTSVTLTTGSVHDTADFGYSGVGAIGDRIWIDRNGDGIQDAGEPGIPGQEVTLTWAGEDGVLGTPDDDVYTTLTGPDGLYVFGALPPGDYTVAVTGSIVAAAANTFDEDGNLDSSAPVVLGDGEVRETTDFGYQGTSSLGDTIWLDLNADGIRDAGEPGIPGVEVVVTWYGADGLPGGGDDVVYPVVTTDVDGTYLVDGLPEGNYGVTVVGGVPAGLANTFDEDGDLDEQADVFGLLAGEAYDTADFGYAGSGSIGDTVWLDQDGDGVQDPDEPGIPEVQVTLTWAGADGILGTADDVVLTTTTDGSGAYNFGNLPAGDFTVDIDAGDLPSGVFATADPDGGAANTAAVTLASGEANSSQDFGYQGGAAVGDTVFHDLNGNGIQDAGEPGVEGVAVTVTHHGPDGVLGTPDDVVFPSTTDANGNYGETGIPGGIYTVTIDPGTLPPGSVPGDDGDGGDPTSTTTNIGDAEAVDTVDFPILGQGTLQGIVSTHECTIDGFPLVGVAGVAIRITWDGPAGPASLEVVTAADGSWVAPDLPPGDYTVELVLATLPAGVVPTTPEIATATLGASGAATIDWIVDEPIDIVSRVWEDTNGNGINDSGEPGVAGVMITLRDEAGVAIATAFTDADGYYSFVGLLPGSYTVEIDPATVPPNLVLTRDPDGGSDMVAAAVLGTCDAEISIDFGFRDRDDLPVTGFELGAAVRLGALLLLLGLSLLLAAARRESHDASR